MKKNTFFLAILAITSAFTILSCAEDDGFGVEQVQSEKITFTLATDSNVKIYEELIIEVREVNTGEVFNKVVTNYNPPIVSRIGTMSTTSSTTSTTTNPLSLDLPKGSYKVTVSGKVELLDGTKTEVASSTDFDSNSGNKSIEIKLFAKQFSKDFIIEEIFYTSNPTTAGKAYNSGRYFKLVNNTDKTIYADQLIIAVSDLTAHSTNKFDPYNNSEYLPVRAVMVLPGNGTEYPVVPGDFIVVADNAINHSAINSNAYNLINANFEFPNNNPSLGNVDNPNVPNAKVIFTTYNFDMFYLFNYSADGFVIARFPEGQNSDNFLKNYKYDYKQTTATGTESNKSTYKIPNTWIIDGVNNAYTDKLIQLVLGASIDTGYATAGTSSSNSDRYGKSVRRIIIGKTEEGKNVYKDTNNSSSDFTKSAEPSLKNGIIH